jgi:geranylgeranyl pyrophosphate synthase
MGELYLKWNKDQMEQSTPESFEIFEEVGLTKAFFSYEEIESLLIDGETEIFNELKIKDYLAIERKKTHILNVLYCIGYDDIEDNPVLHKQMVKSIELFKEGIVIQDDFYDKADRRHGTDSVFKKCGGEKAALIGEIFISTAFLIYKDVMQKYNVPEQIKIQALAMFEEVHKKINLGQLLDLELEKEGVIEATETEYFKMISLTTSSFIQFPLILGSLLHKSPFKERQKLEEYGHYIGLAHQIRDDILDIIGDPNILGKPFASDIRNKKKRLPLLCVLDHLDRDRVEYIENSFKQNEKLPDQIVNKIVEIIREEGGLDYCKSKLTELTNKALICAEGLSSTIMVERLKDLAFWLTNIDISSYSSSIYPYCGTLRQGIS